MTRARRSLSDKSPPYAWERIAIWVLLAFCLGVEQTGEIVGAARALGLVP